MEVRASTKLDKRSLYALLYASLYRKTKPVTALVFRLLVVSAVAVLIVAVLLLDPDFADLSFIFFCLLVFVLFLFLFDHFAIPAIRLKRYSKLIGSENRYVFRDDAVTVSTESPGATGESVIGYETFVRVLETSEFFFAYMPNNTAFAIDKSTIEGGSFLDIREAFASRLPEKKYVLCNY